MGEAFITRRGGSSAKVYAVIGVTYPSGATCTCTNGSKTLTAKDTSGKAIFVIPSGGQRQQEHEQNGINHRRGTGRDRNADV